MPDVSNIEKVFEHLSIKLINKYNFVNNIVNAPSFFIYELSPEDHIFVSLFYILQAFDRIREEIKNINFEPRLLDPTLGNLSSQETIDNIADYTVFKTVGNTENCVEFKNIEVGKLVNITGQLEAIYYNEFGIHFALSSKGIKILVRYTSSDEQIVKSCLIRGRSYMLSNVIVENFKAEVENINQIKWVQCMF